MSGRRRSPAPALDPWEDEGRRVAAQLGGVSAAVIVATDGHMAARLAIGVARAVVQERRVAIADLVGGSTALDALAGPRGGPGIVESFQQGVSLNDVARPAADGTPSLFILPLGAANAAPVEVMQSDRWRRLAAGFADAGALLLIAARADAPSLDALVKQTDGVVAVGEAAIPIDWRVITQAGERAGAVPSKQTPRARSRRPLGLSVAALLLLASVYAPIRYWPRLAKFFAPATKTSPPALGADSARAAVPRGAPAAAPGARRAAPPDTVAVPVPVNPLDSAVAAQFALELVATNTVSGANSWLREHGASLPGATVSPVPMGAAGTRWHKVIVGAWRDRASADSLLAALRDARVVRAGAGVVVRVPLAWQLESQVPRGSAAARVAALAARAVRAYALVQDDGTVRVFAGAFEIAADAVALGAELRAQGLNPQLAYRTGRTF